ncbi:Superkiller viralicidic activity 2-like 2 [Tritrichomonas foetus]|uniref:Superkiller viralicidic activity 2-like 2 n=1 Tax=Tritrichomonas foetus TaxID=1144522 RepID=A0A1J4J5X6_9EUKA|nr:Superkiller viralicidic activity 2-like 2 [Tritrichomonas foetus]|eukprot:OHS93551.1 Superkiller viralicidic activity 2-like 2 [Tritrichomonas foetus]
MFPTMIQAPPDFVEENETIKTIKIETKGDNIVHYAALPSGQTTIDPVEFPEDPVYNYPFELDEFQKCAVSCVHRNESVLVSAHTSAGKTAIAIYAVSMALKNKSRVVYTSPIKALSNQKYHDLKSEFDDVGLLTGDISINPSASILVMTTEILRMMLFTGDTLIREISWVIYDEVHYMKDPERGVVWEESIILLPDAIRFVFLSATIPNAREFSEWIAQLHNQVCHVVYTEHRPIPLRYYLSPMGDTQNYLVRNADGEIIDNAFNLACSVAANASSAVSTFRGVDVKSPEAQSFNKPGKKAVEAHTCQIISQMIKSDLYPMIVFVFSRKECDRIPDALGNQSFNKPEEKALVRQTFENAISRLDECDRNLPQIEKTLSLVERGIGVHHGGLLPIMKEIVEILFAYGLIKILFATETFAMGLNMPSKTVIFNDLYKFDGNERRLLASGEFIQMSGRAGRRNKDKFGVVSINYTGETPPLELKSLMVNAAQPLNSEFRVTYNMLLNLLQTSYMEPKQLMRKSFHQFQMLRELPDLQAKLQYAKEMADSITMTNEELTAKAVDIESKLISIEEDMKEIALDENNISSLLVPGRLLKVKVFGWSVCASGIQKKGGDILIIAYAEETRDKRMIKPTSSLLAKPHIIKIPSNNIEEIGRSAMNISFDSISNETAKKVMLTISKLEKQGISSFDPIEYIKTGKETFLQLKTEQERLFNIQKSLSATESISSEAMTKYKNKQSYLDEIKHLYSKIEALNHLVNQKDLDAMKSVLHRLNFVDDDGIVQLKGRVAAAITAADEIVLTELLIDGIFADLQPDGIVALMTAFVGEENSKSENDDIPKPLENSWLQLQRIIQKIATISLECGCDLDVEKFKRGFSSSFMELALLWASGTSFSTLMETFSNYYEGSIIRTMKRLDELLHQVANAAKILNDKELESRFNEASKLINRGIMFSASIYALD